MSVLDPCAIGYIQRMPSRRPLASAYRVRIDYREPTYEARVGPKRTPYTWTYEVVAPNEKEAAQIALREFRETARVSSVGWLREVVGIQVRHDVA
jgi:hypothetical protein